MCRIFTNICRSQWPRGIKPLRPLACWDCGFESHRGHGCLSVESVLCCQRSLRRIDHSSRGVLPNVARRCVWSRNLENEEAKARYRAVKIQPQWVVTAGKQTTNIHEHIPQKHISGYILLLLFSIMLHVMLFLLLLLIVLLWSVRGSNPGGLKIFRTPSYRPWGPPTLLYNGYCVFPGDKVAGAWRWPPTPYSAEVKERVKL